MIRGLQGGATGPRPGGRHLALLAIFALALAARIAFVLWRGPLLSADSAEYLLLARNLLAHGAFSLQAEPPWQPTTRRAPLYPAFAALTSGGAEHAVILTVLAQALLDATLAVGVALLARTVVPAVWSYAAGLFYAVHPGAIAASASVLSEPLFSFLLGIGVALHVHARLRASPGGHAVAGAVLGAAALTRPLALLFVPALAGLALRARPRPWTHAGALVAGTVVLVAPWSLRSSVAAGELVMVQGNLHAVYVATRTDWDQKDQAAIWREMLSSDPCGERLGPRLGAELAPAEQAAADRHCRALALRNIAADPLGYLLFRLRHWPYLWLSSFDSFTGLDLSFRAAWHERLLGPLALKIALLAVFSAAPLLLGLLGAVARWREPAVSACASVWALTALVHAFVFIEPRFWSPVTACLAVTAATGAHALWTARRIPARGRP